MSVRRYPFKRRPHPDSADHEVVEWDTRVHHQLCVPKGLDEAEIHREIARYLRGYDIETPEGKIHIKGYEDIYPKTKVESI